MSPTGFPSAESLPWNIGRMNTASVPLPLMPVMSVISGLRIRAASIGAFFFQAEDGIRDKLVTGVQTCALPISACCAPTSRVPLGQRHLQFHSPHELREPRVVFHGVEYRVHLEIRQPAAPVLVGPLEPEEHLVDVAEPQVPDAERHR